MRGVRSVLAALTRTRPLPNRSFMQSVSSFRSVLSRWEFFAGALLLAALYALQILGVHFLEHDESFSYVVAGRGLEAFRTEAPAGRWVEAEAWQALWHPDGFRSFAEVSHDIALGDIHPPLHFWLLHVWGLVFGVAPWTGPLLNAPFLLATALGIAWVGTALGARPRAALAAAFLWAVSPPALAGLTITRQYALLSLATVALVGAAVVLLQRRSLASVAVFGGVALLGVLTHYHFLLVVLAAGLLVGFVLLRERDWKAVYQLLGASVLAAVGFFVAHPSFYAGLQRYSEWQGKLPPLTWVEAQKRVRQVIGGLFEMAVPRRVAEALTSSFLLAASALVLLAVVGTVGSVLLLRRQRSGPQVALRYRLARVAPLLVLLVVFSVLAALYVGGSSPLTTMTGRYLLLTSPLLYVAVGQGLTVLSRASRPAALAVVGLWVLGHAVFLARPLLADPLQRSLAALPHEQGAPLLVDTVLPAELPAVLWHVPRGTAVYAAPQRDLAASLPHLDPSWSTVVYVSSVRYANRRDAREAVLAALAAEGLRLEEDYGIEEHSLINAFVFVRGEDGGEGGGHGLAGPGP